MRQASLLHTAHVGRQKQLLETALDQFRRGIDCMRHWLDMADAMNVAESLANERICSDATSRAKIAAAQEALAAVHARHAATGSWTLTGAQITALDEAIFLHGVQLDNATHGEFDRAMRATEQRVAQARAGNAPRDAIVVNGLIGQAALGAA